MATPGESRTLRLRLLAGLLAASTFTGCSPRSPARDHASSNSANGQHDSTRLRTARRRTFSVDGGVRLGQPPCAVALPQSWKSAMHRLVGGPLGAAFRWGSDPGRYGCAGRDRQWRSRSPRPRWHRRPGRRGHRDHRSPDRCSIHLHRRQRPLGRVRVRPDKPAAGTANAGQNDGSRAVVRGRRSTTRDLLPLCRAERATHGCLATVDPDEGTVQRTTGARADQFGRLRARRPPCGRPRGLALSTNLRRGRLGCR